MLHHYIPRKDGGREVVRFFAVALNDGGVGLRMTGWWTGIAASLTLRMTPERKPQNDGGVDLRITGGLSSWVKRRICV